MCGAGFCLALLCSSNNKASAQAQGYGLNILDQPERGSEWFATDSLDLRGHGHAPRWSGGLTVDWAHKTLQAAPRASARERAIVRNQLLLQPGLAVVLWRRLRLALDVPVQLYGDGHYVSVAGVGYEPPDQKASLGDVRLGTVMRLFGEHAGPITGAIGVQVALPTGARDAYAGDGSTRVLPHIMLAGDAAGFTYAGKLGVGIRTLELDTLSTHIASYTYFAVSIGVRMFDRRFVLGPELLGQTQLTHDELWKRRATPVEALLGMHYSFDSGARIGAAIGFGLTNGLGAPEQRGLLSLEWNTPVPAAASPLTAAEPDRDGDGISDEEDACPERSGPLRALAAERGCPRPEDTDRDGVRDVEDACPEHPGARSDDPANSGCPKPKDRDSDGVSDANDACPDVAGAPTADPQSNGCPTS